jgi:hypothetical protein
MDEFAKERRLCCNDDDHKIAFFALHACERQWALNGRRLGRGDDCGMAFTKSRCKRPSFLLQPQGDILR